jgi:hypothetical protein
MRTRAVTLKHVRCCETVLVERLVVTATSLMETVNAHSGMRSCEKKQTGLKPTVSSGLYIDEMFATK